MRAASTPQGVNITLSIALGSILLFGTLANVGYQGKLHEDINVPDTQRYKPVIRCCLPIWLRLKMPSSRLEVVPMQVESTSR
jgi:hypothetical protein